MARGKKRAEKIKRIFRDWEGSWREREEEGRTKSRRVDVHG
jgi:hypothetical protein